MWNSMIKPTLVLFVVCLVISSSLAYVNGVTKDVIEQNTEAEKKVFRKQVLENAERFVKVEPSNASEAVKNVYEGYKGDEISGYVVELTSKGYGGDISMTVGISSDKKVTGVIIGSNGETPGLGSKATGGEFIGQFDGISIQEKLALTKQNKKAANEIQAVSGATITSRGVTNGVQAALDLVNDMMEGGK